MKPVSTEQQETSLYAYLKNASLVDYPGRVELLDRFLKDTGFA